MQAKVLHADHFAVPEEILHSFHGEQVPVGFETWLEDGLEEISLVNDDQPTLFVAHLPAVLDWLHGLDTPKALEKEPCDIPVLLYDKELVFDRLLFHYDGTPSSARLINNFLKFFSNVITNSKATIISPSFIPKSKMKEEQEIIQHVVEHTAEASFIKFNFCRIGDFWSYAVKHECTLLVTTKNYQTDLAKVLFHFYRGGMWYDRLSFYLAP
ncbi:hypothetical protein ADIS_2311 [Lunatimonas lonarensis]|uniref:Uncharacterized protein n=1 Tax=Lunatimonas lonarensis TaxID=1232681 RepID=R7ZSV4_9BACT|nr:hypothetical protein [Lunatimonas lonarensis]EON77231.1 hypothetical protein ADIS_2311 [Lunatimonas lonarensis]